jgi:hypothetical protein
MGKGRGSRIEEGRSCRGTSRTKPSDKRSEVGAPLPSGSESRLRAAPIFWDALATQANRFERLTTRRLPALPRDCYSGVEVAPMSLCDAPPERKAQGPTRESTTTEPSAANARLGAKRPRSRLFTARIESSAHPPQRLPSAHAWKFGDFRRRSERRSSV